ncbi:hypothetical protein PQX77_021221 [Marasmius sp. AFHP31]|nr:hypothetical protein PQX77_021221 [Marasmius sp. AFHP31]
MSSQFFQSAQNTQITGGSFNHVHGDQVNYTTTIVQAEKKELTLLDEYFYVKRGAIYKMKENGRYLWEDEERWGYRIKRHGRADRISYAVEIVDRPGRVFTLVEYSGPEAKQAFENDFAMLISGLTLNGPQVYGYNLSAAPSILIYNELVPAAQVNAGVVGRVYLNSICWQLDCEEEELWLDPGKGVFCRGLPGPTLRLGNWIFHSEELPLTAELVQEDVLLRFLAGLKSKHVDDVVVREVAFSGASTLVPERVLRPTVISTLTNAPIAVANNTWTSHWNSLSHRKLLADGMTRFTLADGDNLQLKWNWDAEEAWMTQAWSVFGARGISMEEDLSLYRASSFSTPLPSTDIFQAFSSLVPGCLATFQTLKPVNDPNNPSFSLSNHLLSTSTPETPLPFISGPLIKTATLRSRTTSASTLAFQRHSTLFKSPSHTLGQMKPTTPYANINSSEGLTQPPLVDGASMLAAHLSAPEGPITAHPIQKPLEATTYNARRSSFWSPIFLPPSSEISGSSDTPAQTRDLDIEDID